MSYGKCDLFLICFSVQNELSLEHAEERWIPEIRMHHPTTPFILVGTKIDCRFATPDAPETVCTYVIDTLYRKSHHEHV